MVAKHWQRKQDLREWRAMFYRPMNRGGNPALKAIIGATIGLSLFSALFGALFPRAGFLHPLELFSLSLPGISKGFIWQFFTHFFIYPTVGGLAPMFLINLAFSIYMIWSIGSLLIHLRGVKDFLYLYIGAGVFSGALTLLILYLTGLPLPIVGLTPPLYAMLTAWMLLFPQAEVVLFFAIPIRIKWLILGILSFSFLSDLSQGHFLGCVQLTGGVLFGLLYGILRWKSGVQLFKRRVKREAASYARAKVYDFKTGEAVLDDETFFSACLTKIATEGRKSLTLRERLRLWRIGKRRAR